MKAWKKILVAVAIVVAVVAALTAYWHFVPWWAALATALAFITGAATGYVLKLWIDKHVTEGL